jgi:hypothetical protein
MLYIKTGSGYYQAYFTPVRPIAVSPEPYSSDAIRGIFWCHWTYWVTLAMAALGYSYFPAGSVRTVLILTPILPALLIVSIAYWVYQACDEYIRLRILRSVAVTAITFAMGTLGYFILELFGFPRLSMVWLNLLGWSVFNVQMLYVIYRSR